MRDYVAKIKVNDFIEMVPLLPLSLKVALKARKGFPSSRLVNSRQYFGFPATLRVVRILPIPDLTYLPRFFSISGRGWLLYYIKPSTNA